MVTPKMLALVALAGLGLSAPAFAYVDPGTGSMLLQGLLAALAAGLFYLRGRWTAFKEFCARVFQRPGSRRAEDDDSSDDRPGASPPRP